MPPAGGFLHHRTESPQTRHTQRNAYNTQRHQQNPPYAQRRAGALLRGIFYRVARNAIPASPARFMSRF